MDICTSHNVPRRRQQPTQSRRAHHLVWVCTASAVFAAFSSRVVAQSAAPSTTTCPDAALLVSLARTATDAADWQPILRALRPPRAHASNDFQGDWCGAPRVEVSHYWANGVGGECASLAVRVVQACGVGECAEGDDDPIHARIMIDARGRPRVTERLTRTRQRPPLQDRVTGLPITHAIPHDDGLAHTIVPTRDGRLHPWQIADARLPDLDGDGWPEFFLQGPDSRRCALTGDNCSDYCCVYSRQAFVASSRTGTLLAGPLVYSGILDASAIGSAMRRASDEVRRSESCPANADEHILAPPAAFLSAPEPRVGSSQVTLRAARSAMYCQEYAWDVGYGWPSNASCVPSNLFGDSAHIALPPLESWSFDSFTGRLDVREVWPAPAALPVSSRWDSHGCAGFVSGVPVVTTNLTAPLEALHLLAVGPDGLLLEGPDGRVICASRSGSSVVLTARDLVPGQYRLHIRSGSVGVGSSNLHLGISTDGPVSEDAIYTTPSRFCPDAGIGPCCQAVADRSSCHLQG